MRTRCWKIIIAHIVVFSFAFSAFPLAAWGVMKTQTPSTQRKSDKDKAHELAYQTLLSVLPYSILGVSPEYQRANAVFNLVVRNPSKNKFISLQGVQLAAYDPAVTIASPFVSFNTTLAPRQSVSSRVVIQGVLGNKYVITALPYVGARSLAPFKFNVLIPGGLLLAPKDIFDLNKIFTCNEDFPEFKTKTKKLILGGKIEVVQEKITEMEAEELNFPDEVPDEFREAVVQYREFLLSFLPQLQKTYEGIQKDCNLLLFPGTKKTIDAWKEEHTESDQNFIQDFFESQQDLAATFDAIIQEFKTTLDKVKGKPEPEAKKVKKSVKDKVQLLNNFMVKYNKIVSDHRALMKKLIQAFDENSKEAETTTLLQRLQPLKNKADALKGAAEDIEREIKKLAKPLK